MTDKRKLREAEGYNTVFLTDNLTPQRSKLLRKLKAHPKVKSAWSVDGKLKVVQSVKGRDSRVTVDSLGDVSHLGWSEEELDELDIFG